MTNNQFIRLTEQFTKLSQGSLNQVEKLAKEDHLVFLIEKIENYFDKTINKTGIPLENL